MIALLGAESTGKTQLAEALAPRLAGLTGWRCTWVPEALRAWCAAAGRTPRADEQPGIAQAQQQAIEAAARSHDLVVCDTTPLMTAVYSRYVFGDRSLLLPCSAWHRAQVQQTLLTALDLPWEPDGIQRDGPEAREPVDAMLREALLEAGLGWSTVRGAGTARVDSAIDALAPWLRQQQALGAAAPDGLFSRLLERETRAEAAGWTWRCADCDDPDCEHALRQGAAAAQPAGPAGPQGA